MHEFEEHTINALKDLFDKVHVLRQINIRDMLLPEIYQRYEDTLQEAYDMLTTVEDALTALGMKLEYEHFRLGGAADELKPLMIQPRSNGDRVMEAMHERLQHVERQFGR